jgi:hypothetical protein
MTARRSPPERLAVLEQQVSHMEAELDRMSAKVDEMHAILLQARAACAGRSSRWRAWWAFSPASRIG